MAKKTHGMSKKCRLYRNWQSMKSRCYGLNNIYYKNYGGRGIRVCEEWINSFETFKDWALNNGYSDKLTLDRKNVNGNYTPDNCKWSTMLEQSRNTRRQINGAGVCWDKRDKVWRAYITKNYKIIFLGNYKIKEEAIIARKQAEKDYWENNMPILENRLPKHNTSGIKGVKQVKSTKKWIAFIQHNYKSIHLGTFETQEEAIKARKEAEIKLRA